MKPLLAPLLGLAAELIVLSSAHAGNARSNMIVINPEDSPLKTKCRSEAALIGGGGKSALQRAPYTRQLRRAHFRKCMHEG